LLEPLPLGLRSGGSNRSDVGIGLRVRLRSVTRKQHNNNNKKQTKNKVATNHQRHLCSGFSLHRLFNPLLKRSQLFALALGGGSGGSGSGRSRSGGRLIRSANRCVNREPIGAQSPRAHASESKRTGGGVGLANVLSVSMALSTIFSNAASSSRLRCSTAASSACLI
jgi:hypothetical protein